MTTFASGLHGLQAMLIAIQTGTKVPASSVGAIGAVIVMEGLMVANTGNPFEFDDAEHAWQDLLKDFRVHPENVLQDYNNLIKGDWVGNGGNAFDSYVNTTLKNASDSLITLLGKLAETSNTIQGAVTTADGAILIFTIVSVVFLNVLFAAYVSTVGMAGPALVAAVVAYILGLGTAIVAVATMFTAFQTAAQSLQTAVDELAAKVWRDADNRKNTRLAPAENLPDLTQWRHSPLLDPKP